jgi:proteasome accessory factor BC
MSRDEDKLIRQLSLLSFLLSRPRPFTAAEVQESVEGYADMSDQTFVRRFYADRADLGKIGIDIQAISRSDTDEQAEVQLYFLREEDFRLPAVEFTPEEVKTLSLALGVLDGRFAYARPLRMALTAILRGHKDPIRDDLDQLPVALAPDEDARRGGRQLSRLEEAVTRGKTVCFSYPAMGGEGEERILDPYSLFLIQGRWYVVGWDHRREAIRTFRLGRIQGPVRFRTEKARDFSIPSDYDPDSYRARPPWLIGQVRGTAILRIDRDLDWWVKRLEPHVAPIADETEGVRFSLPYADDRVLLSWVAGLGERAELLQPEALRDRLRSGLLEVSRSHEAELPPATQAVAPSEKLPRAASRGNAAPDEDAPIAPERLTRAITLLCYLLNEQCPGIVSWQVLKDDLGLTRAEAEADIALINLVNFGGGTYALTAEASSEGIAVVPDVMADAFSHPARLSPVMARALLLALDLLGDTLAVDSLESLARIREKVQLLAGPAAKTGIIADEVLAPDSLVVETLNQAIRDHLLVELEYYTSTRQELSFRLVEPYLLFHSSEGWYLEAYCLSVGAQRTFKLERIKTASATNRSFSPRSAVDLSLPRAGRAVPETVATCATVGFRARWAGHIEDRVIDCRALPDGSLEARIPYLDERWLVQEIIRYLGDAVLQQPVSVRSAVAAAARALAGRYAPSAEKESAGQPLGGTD